MEPKEIRLPFRVDKAILALGSQTKNALCFAEDKTAFFSPIHQDLNDPKDFSDFKRHVKYFLKKSPKIIACDLHPEYQSTKFALSLSTVPACRRGRNCQLSTIQHHHAHIASCMAENGFLNQRVIGVAFDGTGLGTDNNIWGAEFLICDYADFKRAAHLKYIPLLGGEKAISEPWRLVYAWGLNKKKMRVLEKMLETGFNSPLASSMGRLFDAAASLVLGKARANFEAELAIELEKLAMHHACLPARQAPCTMCYNYKIIRGKAEYIIDPTPLLKEIITDLKRREPKEKIAYRFHLTVAGMMTKVCSILRKETGINKIFLSGGVFQNNLLLDLSRSLLYKEQFKTFMHKRLSCNDSGISLGQMAIANFRR